MPVFCSSIMRLLSAGMLLLLMPVPMGFVAQAAAAPAPSASDELAQAVAALRGIETLQADFIQTSYDGVRVSGVMTLKRPGRIRFQYEPGYPLLIVSDGAALTVVDTGLRKMQRWPIGNSPLGALLDPSRDVSRYGRVLPDGDASIINIEVHDRAHPEYGILTLSFERKAGAPNGLELMGWASLDAQNRRTLVRLTHHHYGVAAPNSLFRYANPLAGPHH